MALTSRSASASSDCVENARTSSSGRDAVRRAGVVAEVDRRFVAASRRTISRRTVSRRRRSRRPRSDADRTCAARSARAAVASRPASSSSLGRPASTSWLIAAAGLGQHERHALVVRLDDEAAVRDDAVLRDAAERPLQVDRVDAARRVRAVDQVADLGRRVADRAERVGHGDRVVDRRRVVGDDLDDRVARVEEGEVDVVEVAATCR